MVWWIESASASPTEPRSPPHHSTTASCHVQPVPSRRSTGHTTPIATPRATSTEKMPMKPILKIEPDPPKESGITTFIE